MPHYIETWEGFGFRACDCREPEFYNKYNALFVASFGERAHLDAQWFEWFNLNCPNGPNEIFVMEDLASGEFVAAYGLLPLDIQFRGRPYKASLCTNGMTHPAYFGRGLFKQIGKLSLAYQFECGVEIVIGIPNTNAIRGHLSIGWQQMPSLNFLAKEKAAFKPPAANKLIPIDRFEENSDGVLREFHNKYSFFVSKTHRFLNWRFVDRPHIDYRCLLLPGDQSPNGYLVYKLYSDKTLNKLHIVDYAYRDPSHFSEMLRDIDEYALSEKVDLINLWHLKDNNREGSILAKHEYADSQESNLFILYSAIAFGQESVNDWHLVLGDNDVY